MGPSYANLFADFIEKQFFSQHPTAPNLNSTDLKYTWEISDTSLAFLDIKISTEGNGLCTGVYYKPKDLHSYLLYSYAHPSHVKNSIPISQFPDFVVYKVTTLIFRKNQRQCASFLINMAILSLSFKRATTVPNKLIESQHYKRLRRKTLTALHSLSHFTLTTTELNQLFLKTLNYSKTIQRLELSFRNLH